MTLEQMRRHLRQVLASRFGEGAGWEADRLIAASLGLATTEIELKKNRSLSVEEEQQMTSRARERLTGKPLEYILGYANFLDLRLAVDARVLIPRLDSEAMVLKGVQFLHQLAVPSPRVVDMGAGSGALGFALLRKFSGIHLWSVEKDPGALEILKLNRAKLGFEKSVSVVGLDLDSDCMVDLPENADLILANPPYIDILDDHLDADVKLFEPHMALFAADRGLEKIFHWSQKALSLLSSKGLFLCEIGWQQAPMVLNWYNENLSDVAKIEFGRDLSGADRFFSLQKRD